MKRRFERGDADLKLLCIVTLVFDVFLSLEKLKTKARDVSDSTRYLFGVQKACSSTSATIPAAEKL